MNADSSFLSLAALRAGHKELLKKRRADGETEPFLAEIKQFIVQGKATGQVLDGEGERWEAQNLLDYWSNEYYHLTQEDLNATLEEYDITQEPELDDSLCPYIGLDPFDTQAHNLFFGREPLVKSMLERLENGRFLALSGPSGSGKTSLVLAGLLPELQQGSLPGSQSWLYLPTMVPGHDPVQNLINILRTPDNTAGWIVETTAQLFETPQTLTNLINRRANGERAVLVIDQFEETFTLCQDQAKRHAFMSNLLNLVSSEDTSHILILTMRTDLENNLVHLVEFQAAYAAAQMRITTMNAAELRQAIEQPAELVGLKFEEALVNQLVSDVLGEPAALPLLQFTLLKLWEARDRNRVTWEAYQALGSGRDALANTADRLYNNLNPAEQLTTRRILLKMVRPTQGLDVVRNRVLRKQLYDPTLAPARVDHVVNHLVRERLIRLLPGDSAANDQLEIAHEALVRHWPRLIGWLEEDRVFLRHRLRLTQMAEQWESLQRDESALIRGVVLEEAQQYADLSDLEKAFVEASIAAVRQEELTREAATRRELEQARQFARRLTFLVIALAFVFLLALGFALLARSNRLEAEENALVAQANEATAVANEQVAEDAQTTAEANFQIANQNAATAQAAKEEAEISAAVAATAFAIADEQRQIAEEERQIAEANEEAAQDARATAEANEAQAATNARLATARELAAAALTQLVNDPQLSLLLALEAVNLTLAAGQQPPTEATDVLYRAVRASQQIQTLAGHTGPVNEVAVSSDGRWLATASDDLTVKLWDATTGQEVTTLSGHTAPVTSLAFSADNSHLLSGDEDSLLIIWDVAAGSLVRALRGEDDGAVRAVAFHPDNERIAAGYEAGTARVWNYVTSVPLLRQFEHAAAVTDIEFVPDGSSFATAGEDGIIVVQNTATGVPITSFEAEINDAGEAIPVLGIAYSEDGTQLAAAKADGEAQVWRGETFQATFSGHNGPVFAVAFNDDGTRLATAGADGSAKVWDLSARRAILTLSGHTGGVTAVHFFPGEDRLVTASLDETARTWNGETGLEPLLLTDHRGGITSLRYSPDGGQVTTASDDQTARVWDAGSGELLATFSLGQPVHAAVLHPSLPILATASEDWNVRFWDSTTREIIEPFYFHDAFVNDLAYNSDGTLLATGADDGMARVWDTETHTRVQEWEHEAPVESVAFSPDGQQVVATSGETAVIWDVNSGQSLPPISGHNGLIHHAIFSPDGTRLATAGADGLVKLWDLETGEAIRTFSGHTGPVLAIAFNEDGSQLATASVDRTARLWDVNAGQVIRTFAGHTSAVTAVDFSPTDEKLATASLDSTARITPLTTINDLLAQAWERLARPLSPAECGQYLHGLPCLTTTIDGPPPTFAP